MLHAQEGEIAIEVLAQLDAHRVRGIALTPTQGLARGMTVEDTGGPLKAPVGKGILSRMFDVFGKALDREGAVSNVEWRTVHRAPPALARRSTKSEVFETGIKVIDVLVPLERGGKAGLFGGAGVGKTVEAIAHERSCAPFDAYIDLIVENGHQAEAIFDYIDERNIRLLLQHPAVLICSDGQVLAPYGFLNDPPPYCPCCYGEFPGVLERYVRDEPVLTLEEAIRKMTSFPAQRFGLHDRGVLRTGLRADVVVFDAASIGSHAGYDNPCDKNCDYQTYQYLFHVFLLLILTCDRCLDPNFDLWMQRVIGLENDTAPHLGAGS